MVVSTKEKEKEKMKETKTKKTKYGWEGKIEGVIDYSLSIDQDVLTIHLPSGDLSIHLPSYKKAGKLLVDYNKNKGGKKQ